MPKMNSLFVCSSCGAEYPKWSGQCSSCKEWNTLEEQEIFKAEERMKGLVKRLEIKRVSDISSDENTRVPSGFKEFDRVLGKTEKSSGFVAGEVLLVAGEPGIGKSTLLLQVLADLAGRNHKTIYVSAEESEGQIAMRAKRIVNTKEGLKKMNFLGGFDIDSIIQLLIKEKPEFVVLDSIQTVSSSNVRGMAGGISQIKYATLQLVELAKTSNTTVMIVGHINKLGNVAGPKVLEHLVDAVLQIEGDEAAGYRLVRALKNRFGTTNEVGILGMDEKGLKDLKDATSYFVSKDEAPGVCRTAILEGKRVIVVEIQALTNVTNFAQPKRVAQGIPYSKLQVICAILQKHAKLPLYERDVYVNVAGGLKITSPDVDLAVALAIASSEKNKLLSSSSAALGELSLTGRIGRVTRKDSKVGELKRLGYTKVFDTDSAKDVMQLIRKVLR